MEDGGAMSLLAVATQLYDAYLDEWDMQRVAFHELSPARQEAWFRVARYVEAHKA